MEILKSTEIPSLSFNFDRYEKQLSKLCQGKDCSTLQKFSITSCENELDRIKQTKEKTN